jgi:hypothetical protein
MDEMIAFCGLTCTACRAYLTTQAGDLAALEKVAAEWREEFNAPNITVDTIMCDGCTSDSRRLCSHCYECEIRACGLQRQVANCAHCDDYACAKLEAFLSAVPSARTTLDDLRRPSLA